ncbi:hypothetical protein ABPG74_007155 [Tetrahymena malaccensis]
MKSSKFKVNITEKLIQWLIISLFIYNNFIAVTIVTIQNMEYMISQIILYCLQKLCFFYYCKDLKWKQVVLEIFEIGILTIRVRDQNCRALMVGYFLRVFLILYCQLFLIFFQPTFSTLLLHKQILIIVSQILISIIITIAQSMKVRYFTTFLTRWLFQICLFGLFVLLLVGQTQSVVIPYLIIKAIIVFIANLVAFRKQYQNIKNQLKYCIFALIFYCCIDHGPFYDFRRKKTKSEKVVLSEVLLYTLHVFRFNQLLQILDCCSIFLIDYSSYNFSANYGKFTIGKAPESIPQSTFDYLQVISYIRSSSEILLSLFVSLFITNQFLFLISNKYNNHHVYCAKNYKLKEMLLVMKKNNSLRYFYGSIADIDKGQFSHDKEVNQDLQDLLEQSISPNKYYNLSFNKIKIKDHKNAKLIVNKGEEFEIDYVFHDFFMSALQKMQIIQNKKFIYLEEDNQMTLQQKQQIQDSLNMRIIKFGIQDIQIIVGNTIFKQDPKYQIYNLKIVTFYKYIASSQLINPKYILYDLFN